MPERYLTADTEGFRILCERFWLFEVVNKNWPPS
ncbi:hypothetical protein BFR11_24910 [Shigella sp. FC2383]|nr:hypothetical protein BFR11_24910 [Shigella sp. FC2383]PHU66618.1 hypothetical protein CSW72_26745 [Shigella boydii]